MLLLVLILLLSAFYKKKIFVHFWLLHYHISSNLSQSNVIDKICEEHDSLVYHHFGQSYMSQFTTVKNRIIFSQTCEEYDLGRITSYRALMHIVVPITKRGNWFVSFVFFYVDDCSYHSWIVWKVLRYDWVRHVIEPDHQFGCMFCLFWLKCMFVNSDIDRYN